jgi:lysophospholipase L1-like esterase
MSLRRARIALRIVMAFLTVSLSLAQRSAAQAPAAATKTPTPAKKPVSKRLPAAKTAPGAKARATTKRSSATRSAAVRTSSASRTAASTTARIVGHTTTAAAQTTAPTRLSSASLHPAPTSHVPTVRQQETRQELIGRLTENLANPRVGIENAAALRPYFDQLHQLELDPKAKVVRALQFGDSHTAADMFTGAIRILLQSRWGDGGAGFSYAGYPFAGYRIHGTKRAQSIGWAVEGTHFRDLGSDALLGMGGVSLSTQQSGSWISLEADATSLEVQYLIQPGGGPIEIYDGELLLTTVSTDGPTAAGRFATPIAPSPDGGPHHFEVRTTENAPVRLLGMTTQNASGATYEAIGLNGAEASLLLRWDETLEQTYMEQVNPALIVLAYGTNEASDHTWTEESYAAMMRSLIARCRRLAPNAAILVIGPADRALRISRKGWEPFAGIDRIIAAQRSVCKQLGCAFWDQRSRMGGFGSMGQWVQVQWAQADHTHFTGEGYTELASALFSDIVQQYNTYERPSAMAGGIRQ